MKEVARLAFTGLRLTHRWAGPPELLGEVVAVQAVGADGSAATVLAEAFGRHLLDDFCAALCWSRSTAVGGELAEAGRCGARVEGQVALTYALGERLAGRVDLRLPPM